MKSIILFRNIAVCVLLSAGISMGQEEPAFEGIEFISADSAVNGFLLDNPDLLPFSPVIDPTFNIPDSAEVDLFITDTSLTDTVWVLRDVVLAPGRYRVQFNPLRDYKERTENNVFKLHFEATGKKAYLGMVESYYRAVFILWWP